MMQYKNILVIRNDKIGDFILSWPALALLKNQYPKASITALVPRYTAPLAEICPWIDHCLIDDRQKSFFSDILNLQKNIRRGNFSAVITLFSEFRTGIACWLAGIPVRVAPATKIAQIFYNKTLMQKRSKSLKPEFKYNIDLVKHYTSLNDDVITELPKPPFLVIDKKLTQDLKTKYSSKYNIPENAKIIIIHPGSGGSAINLTTEQYADLARSISKQINAFFIITAGPGEIKGAKYLSKILPNIDHCVYQSQDGIIEFCKFISICDLFVSGSTGPLHIAGALNVNTAAFYPARKSATSLRWETLNTADRRLCFSPEKYAGTNDMQQIDITASAKAIIKKFAL